MTLRCRDTSRPRAAARLAAPRWPVVIALAALLAPGGCGDDPPLPPRPPGAAKSQAPRKARAADARRDESALKLHRKVEDLAATPEEGSALRHGFSPGDFKPDPAGETNRDPFRSYVVQQSRQPTQGQDTPAAISAVTSAAEVCTSKNLVATRYPLRDLRLIGIVLRGTSSFALFRDSTSYGHIVRKGDCLGQERARVAAIRAGFVTLEVMSEASPSQPLRQPQERTIQLHPDELTIEPSE